MSWTTSFVTHMTDNLDNLRRCQDQNGSLSIPALKAL